MKDCSRTAPHRCATRITLYSSLALVVIAFLVGRLIGGEPKSPVRPAPPLIGIEKWINSEPLVLKNLRGQVVVLHFWTFGCINCQRNLPYYNRWQDDYAEEPLQIIGVHTPESAGEAVAENVAAKAQELGIEYPVAIDNNFATWKAYKNRFWPCIYLIDKRGHLRYQWKGELEYDDAEGDEIVREKIKQLLAEPEPAVR